MHLEDGFQLGDYMVSPAEGSISGPDGAVRIEPKAMSVLVELARHPGEVRSREQILEVVWPRGHTTDDTLTRCIGQIRKALHDDAREGRYIQTIPRRGYRLSERLSQPAERAREEADARAGLMVLPLQNLSSMEHGYIADGVTELVTARLGAHTQLRVISRTTATHYDSVNATVEDIRRETGIRWLVEGSVLVSEGALQTVVQLIDAADDSHVWVGEYARPMGDVLLLQNEMASAIVEAIFARMQIDVQSGTAVRPGSLADESVRLYLQARRMISTRTPASLRQALEALNAVCAKQPEFAESWAYRARVRLMMTHYGLISPREAAPACRADIVKALTLDPDLGIARCTEGAIRFNFDWDVHAAERALTASAEDNPSDTMTLLPLANVMAVQGRFTEARSWIERAQHVGPLDVGIAMNVGDHCILRRDYKAAIGAFERALRIEPDHRPSSLRLSWALALEGCHKQALEHLHASGPVDDSDWQWHEYAAIVEGAAGARKASERRYLALVELRGNRFVSYWSLARAAAACEHLDEAIGHLEAARREGSTSFPFLGVTPAFDRLRNDARFRALQSLA